MRPVWYSIMPTCPTSPLRINKAGYLALGLEWVTQARQWASCLLSLLLRPISIWYGSWLQFSSSYSRSHRSYSFPRTRLVTRPLVEAARWGVTNLLKILGEVLQEKDLRRFLLAFFFYIDGVLTAIYMSSTVASTTFGYTQNELVYLFIALQIAALFGAFALAKPTDRLGPKKILTVVCWSCGLLSRLASVSFRPQNCGLVHSRW